MMKSGSKKKVAVVLCGSGYKDGSEIHESVATLWALNQHPIEVQCFAPDADQHDVVNCLTGNPMDGQKRNMLIEAARIARGQVQPLDQLNPDQFDAIVLPGGFGAAKNLCTFAFKGSQGTVRPELKKVLERMHESRKPVGAICIAPAILALALPGRKLELTFGEKCEAAEEIEKLGHKHIVCAPGQCHVDSAHKVVSSPAYMYDPTSMVDVFSGIQKLVAEVVRLA